MKKTFLLKGLNCPNCAAKIENEVKAIGGVTSASINLINQTLALTVKNDSDPDIGRKIEKIVRSHERDVSVIENGTPPQSRESCHREHCHHEHDHDHGHSHEHSHEHGVSSRRRILWIAVGGAVYLSGIIASACGIHPAASLVFMIISYVILGYDVILRALRNILKGRIFDENLLMSLSTAGSFAIGEYYEAVAVMLFYQAGEFFQDLAVERSRRSIASLMDIRPDYANLVSEGVTQAVRPEDVKVGQTILIRPGERIPLDGTVTEGSSSLDVKALTGESMPRDASPGDTVLSGSVNQGGLLTVRVTKAFGDSTASKILELMENASAKKARTENFITLFARYYTPAVVVIAALLAAIPPLALGLSPYEWIRRALVFLVISCPCALVLSIPLTFFGGIGAASRHGILVKGGNYLEALARLDTVIFDKTGTLTKGSFSVSRVLPEEGYSSDYLLSLAAAAESFSTHPIALSILSAYGKSADGSGLSAYRDIPGLGISAELDGAPLLVGNAELMRTNGITYKAPEGSGTAVHVGLGGKYIGHILIVDEIKKDSADAIRRLRRLGISRVVMLTGDSREIAERTAGELGIDEVRWQLLPHQKLDALELEAGRMKKGGWLAFVGDGINDAPVLARADVGIAMGGIGSDAAIEAADVVLMTDEPSKIAEAMDIARKTRGIVLQNIVLILFVKAVFLTLGVFGIAGMWEAVFGDVGVALLAVLNATRILKK